MQKEKENPVKSMSDEELLNAFKVFLTEDIDSNDDTTLDLLQAELNARGLDPFKEIEETK